MDFGYVTFYIWHSIVYVDIFDIQDVYVDIFDIQDVYVDTFDIQDVYLDYLIFKLFLLIYWILTCLCWSMMMLI